MKTTIFATAVVALLFAAAPGKEPNWTGNYTDKKFLNGKAVFQLNILEEGGKISVDFDAVYNDGHGWAPEGNGPATIVAKDTLKFTFTDTAGNAGSGTTKRAGTMSSSQCTRPVWPIRAVLFSMATTFTSTQVVECDTEVQD